MAECSSRQGLNKHTLAFSAMFRAILRAALSPGKEGTGRHLLCHPQENEERLCGRHAGNRDVTAVRGREPSRKMEWAGPQEQCTWDSVREPVYTEARECLKAPSRGTVRYVDALSKDPREDGMVTRARGV